MTKEEFIKVRNELYAVIAKMDALKNGHTPDKAKNNMIKDFMGSAVQRTDYVTDDFDALGARLGYLDPETNEEI